MGGANDVPQEGSDNDIVNFDSSVGLGFENRTVYNGEKIFSSFLDELDHLEHFSKI